MANTLKIMNIAELYRLTPQSTSFKLKDFVCHIHEFAHTSNYINHTGFIKNNEKIEIKALYRQEDSIKYWQLATAWFEGQPFAVIQNAGLHNVAHVAKIQNAGFHNVAHNKAFWTDENLYVQSVLYLRSIFPILEIPELTDINFDSPELLKFHNFSYSKDML
jgi:hypothetical protein